MVKKNLRLIAFILVFLICLSTVYSVLSFKNGDGILGLKYLRQQKRDSVDVLVLGSSHAFEDINTGLLFDTYGIASYVLSGSIQPYWNSYYYLREALKTQTPKLVILEGYSSTFQFEFSDNSRIIKNNLGLSDPLLRLKSLIDSSHPQDIDNYLLPYRLWHSRYSEVNETDFGAYYNTPTFQYYKGYGINFNTQSFPRPELDTVEDTAPMFSKVEEYYNRIIYLCHELNIPLLVVVSPYILSQEHQMLYNYAEQIAKYSEVDFINFNKGGYYDLIGLDFDTDFADSDHLNHRGSVKYTQILGEILRAKYDLPDRRGDPQYETWALHAKDVARRIQECDWSRSTDLETWLSFLSDPELTICVAKFNSNAPEALWSALKISAPSSDRHWDTVHLIHDGHVLDSITNFAYSFKGFLGENVLTISDTNSITNEPNYIKLGQATYQIDKPGTYVLVYDEFEKTMIDVCCIEECPDGHYSLMHLI